MCLLTGMVVALSPVWAGDRPPAAGSGVPRSYPARPIRPSAPSSAQPREAKEPPIRTAQIDSHGRYPFGQFRGGYRYPFNYPYYRYGAPRHYPFSSRIYPFGVGPYGPYGSNYGGYSGNAYDPNVYGQPPANGPALPDAPPAPPAEDEQPPAKAAPGAQSRPGNPAEAEVAAGPVMYPGPAPGYPGAATVPPAVVTGQIPSFNSYINAGWGGPFYGFSGQGFLGGYPFGFYGNNIWFAQNRLLYGFGWLPPQPYYDLPDGTAYGAGYGNFNPQYAPQTYYINGRHYGPTYRTPGGVNIGPGHYDGW